MARWFSATELSNVHDIDSLVCQNLDFLPAGLKLDLAGYDLCGGAGLGKGLQLSVL